MSSGSNEGLLDGLGPNSWTRYRPKIITMSNGTPTQPTQDDVTQSIYQTGQYIRRLSGQVLVMLQVQSVGFGWSAGANGCYGFSLPVPARRFAPGHKSYTPLGWGMAYLSFATRYRGTWSSIISYTANDYVIGADGFFYTSVSSGNLNNAVSNATFWTASTDVPSPNVNAELTPVLADPWTSLGIAGEEDSYVQAYASHMNEWGQAKIAAGANNAVATFFGDLGYTPDAFDIEYKLGSDNTRTSGGQQNTYVDTISSTGCTFRVQNSVTGNSVPVDYKINGEGKGTFGALASPTMPFLISRTSAFGPFANWFFCLKYWAK